MAGKTSSWVRWSIIGSAQLTLGLGGLGWMLTPGAIALPGRPAPFLVAEFEPGVGGGAPGRREGGGTRSGACPVSAKTLTALIPAQNSGVTVSAYPTLLFYVPPITGNLPLEFVLQDEQGNEVYSSTLKATGQGGIITVALPENAGLPALKEGKSYHWFFSMVCNERDRGADIFVEGWIRRVAPNAQLEQELKTAKGVQIPQAYRKQGIWYDTAASLAELYRNDPTNVQLSAAWADLLKAVGLTNLEAETLVAGPSQRADTPTNGRPQPR